MQKILYVVSTLKRTGPTNVLFNLIQSLDKSKFCITVLTLSCEEENQPSLIEDFHKLNIDVISINSSRISSFLFAKMKITSLINNRKINVVHLFGFRPDYIMRTCELPEVKIISTINSFIYDDYTMLYGNIKGSIMSRKHINSLKNKIAIACSKSVSKQIMIKYGIELKAINNGIPKQYYNVPVLSEKNRLRQELGIPLNMKVFIFVGHLIKRKDPLTVVKAFLASKNIENSLLLVIGDGPLKDDCKSLVYLRKENIKFLGNQPSTLNFLQASDYYIASSLSEGLPTSVMEALGCGLPLLLSRIDPHIELMESIPSWHYFFEKSDSLGLTHLIDEIQKEEYLQLQKMCRNIIETKFNSNIMASKYSELYTSPL